MMTFAITMLLTVLVLQFVQMLYAMRHLDEHGFPRGLDVGGLPLDLVLGGLLLPFAYLVLTGVRQDLAYGVGLGAFSCYLGTWGRAFGFTLSKAQNELAKRRADE